MPSKTSLAAILGLVIVGYLIGSSSLFVNAANAIFGASSKTEQRASVFTQGSTDVFVYYCAPSGQYSISDLDNEVANLNKFVTNFFIRESSGLATVNFRRGGLLDPKDVDFANATIQEMASEASRGGELNECNDPKDYGHQALVLADVHTGRAAGFAFTGEGFSMVATPNRHHDHYHFYLVAVAHEIGHAVFGLGHTRETTEPCTDEITWSLMNRVDCVSNYLTTLESVEITCDQRQLLNWPCD